MLHVLDVLPAFLLLLSVPYFLVVDFCLQFQVYLLCLVAAPGQLLNFSAQLLHPLPLNADLLFVLCHQLLP